MLCALALYESSLPLGILVFLTLQLLDKPTKLTHSLYCVTIDANSKRPAKAYLRINLGLLKRIIAKQVAFSFAGYHPKIALLA